MIELDNNAVKKLNKLVDSGCSQEEIENFISDVSDGRLSTIPVKNTEFFKVIGERIVEARGITGYSQNALAKKLGYANSSRLNKIEKGVDIKSISIFLVKKLARVLGVSTDFILGESRDWERNVSVCHGRDITNMVMEEWAKQHINDVKAITYMQRKIDIVHHALGLIVPAMDELNKVFTRFLELNPKFDNMKGGASLVGSISRLGFSVNNAKDSFRRYQLDARSRGFSGQASIFDFD